MDYDKLIQLEKQSFDTQAEERIKHGFVPDLRQLKKVNWFYNNVWRDPEFVKVHWMPRINFIIDRARERGGKVLEMGCGYGMLSLEMARNGLDVTGIDLSPKSIGVANRYKKENPFTDNFGSLEYRCGDITEMDFPPESFDSVVFFRSLHHIAGTAEVMDKAHRIMKPGGYLLISEPVRSRFSEESARFAALLRTVLPTWEPFEKKLGKEWTEQLWEEKVAEIFQEYTYEGSHEQSPMDNVTDDAGTITKAVERHFVIRTKTYSDAFIDKLIGGLRGKHRYELARFLKFLDDYMVRHELLPPTSVEIHAVKEK
jgi:2-polyprenyl-3-methyl-5-hydroxy-6-metoxy-1,4-benzoquinol methylase